MAPIMKLVRLGGAALCDTGPVIQPDLVPDQTLRATKLLDLLRAKNGFYAFESALHVFPAGAAHDGPSLADWNTGTGWRGEYGSLAEGCFFFAEDIFGGQFCLFDGCVMGFDPETGEKRFMASTIEEWAGALLADPDVLTGYPLAHEWQVRHGAVPPGARLIPRVPFVLGGEFTPENLSLIDAARGMRSRANLAVQIRDLPDGAAVNFKLVD